MKTEITNEQIKFQYATFSITIPRENNDIKFYLKSFKKFSSIPTVLLLVPNEYKTSFWGRVMIRMNYFLFLLTLGGVQFNPFDLHDPVITHSLMIGEKNEIEFFLNSLDENGYNVKSVKEKFQEIKNSPVDQVYIPGTKEWKMDRFILLFLVPFIFLEGIYSMAFFSVPNDIGNMLEFIKISAFIALICLLFYFIVKIFSRNK